MQRTAATAVRDPIIRAAADEAREAKGRVELHSEFPQIGTFCDRWSSRLGREVDVKLKADLAPVSEVPRASSGPIEIYRKESFE